MGMLKLRGLAKMFSFIQNCFPKFIAVYQYQESSGNLGLNFVIFEEIKLWGC